LRKDGLAATVRRDSLGDSRRIEEPLKAEF
jgi:hypothetical protein